MSTPDNPAGPSVLKGLVAYVPFENPEKPQMHRIQVVGYDISRPEMSRTYNLRSKVPIQLIEVQGEAKERIALKCGNDADRDPEPEPPRIDEWEISQVVMQGTLWMVQFWDEEDDKWCDLTSIKRRRGWLLQLPTELEGKATD